MLRLKNGQTAAIIQAKPKLNIQFKRKRYAKKQLYKNKQVFILYTPKKVTLKPHGEVTLNLQIQIDFPDVLIPEFVFIPSLTKQEIEAGVSQYTRGNFYQISLFNKSFTSTVKIGKHTGIVALYFLNDKDYILNIKSAYIKN